MARYCHYCGKVLKDTPSKIRKHLQKCFTKTTMNYIARVSSGKAGHDTYKEVDNDRK